MEVLDIEQSLSSKAAKEDIRHDLTFYTPTCRDVRVKVLVAPEWWGCNQERPYGRVTLSPQPTRLLCNLNIQRRFCTQK